MVDHGETIAEGTPAEVKTNPRGARGLPRRRAKRGSNMTSSEPSTSALELSDVSVAYGGIRACKNVSLTVARGEIVTLIGANGAGKTQRPPVHRATRSAREWHGARAWSGRKGACPPIAWSGSARALVPEGRAIFGNLSVRENLMLGRVPEARRTRSRRALGTQRSAVPAPGRAAWTKTLARYREASSKCWPSPAP